MDYGPQSVCVPSNDTNDANCVEHRCVQIQGTELLAFSLTINGTYTYVACCKVPVVIAGTFFEISNI